MVGTCVFIYYIFIQKTLLFMVYIDIYSILFSELMYLQNIFSKKKRKAVIILIMALHNLMPTYKVNINTFLKETLVNKGVIEQPTLITFFYFFVPRP